LKGEHFVLVDTGMPGDSNIILQAIKDIGYSPDTLQYIFVTHAHLDHVGSLAAVKAATGAKVVASHHEKDHIEGRRMLCSMQREGIGGKVFRMILFIMEKFLFKYKPTQLDIPFQGSDGPDHIAGIQIIEAPGHSLGSLCFLHNDKKILLTGDALSHDPHLRLPPRVGCTNYSLALGSVQRLADLEFEVCLFGHGPPMTHNARSQVKALLEGIL
jgi:glyoxylase-like metal-dependent hydrolase (beta-lactamase superfamily II)